MGGKLQTLHLANLLNINIAKTKSILLGDTNLSVSVYTIYHSELVYKEFHAAGSELQHTAAGTQHQQADIKLQRQTQQVIKSQRNTHKITFTQFFQIQSIRPKFRLHGGRYCLSYADVL